MIKEMIVIIIRMKQLPDTDCLYDIMGYVICLITNPEEVARHCFHTPVGKPSKVMVSLIVKPSYCYRLTYSMTSSSSSRSSWTLRIRTV